MLFIVSGASGVGKSSLCSLLIGEFEELEMSISFTTRAPRGQEVDGVHYHFVDEPGFRGMIDGGAFAEWAEVHGNLYGTSRGVIDAVLAAGRSVLFDIDYQGAESLMRAYPDDTVATMVLPPSMRVLESRLRGRGTDDPVVVARRLDKARSEIAHAESFDYLVVNDDLDVAYDTLRAVYVASRQRTARVWPRVATGFRPRD